MVLIFDPIITEVIKIRKIGKIFTNIKKSNFLSFKLILNFTFFINNHDKKKKGISITDCFNKNKNGYLI